jgi:hypothetical protein
MTGPRHQTPEALTNACGAGRNTRQPRSPHGFRRSGKPVRPSSHSPAPLQPLQRPVDPVRLLVLRAQVQAAIADIDAALPAARIRRIERRSAVAAQQRPVGVPIEYHGGGRVLGVR